MGVVSRPVLGLLAVCLAMRLAPGTASKVTDSYYTPIINQDQPSLIQEFPVLLDAEGQIGSTTGFGNASGVLFLVVNATDVERFKGAPAKECVHI